ncbi:MAG: hypothetical protein JWO36_5969 [Myxococcales bacterium]|nr:hypothetical protein [Myxococcales bacterium]
MTTEITNGAPRVWDRTRRGVTLVGDENELFYLNRDNEVGTFLVRVRPTAMNHAAEPISIPRLDVTGPAVDDTYVYWSEGSTSGFLLRRALRSGDGSDVTTIATTPLRPEGMVVFGGFLYWGSLRVPVTGGTPAPFTSEPDVGIIAVGANVLYVAQYLPPNGYTVRVATMTVNGDMQTLVDLPQYEAPVFNCILDRGQLFWTTTHSTLNRMEAVGSTPVAIGNVDSSQAFGLTADAILYRFTETGYQTMPR